MIEQKKFGIIIEARTNSKRFKNKILKKIYKNYSVLDYILKKLKTQKIIKNIVVATTTKKNDAVICNICKKRKIDFFRGSENDLIKRVADAAKQKKIEHIIQLTSDNPFVDMKILKKLVKIYSIGRYDFVTNCLKRSFPIGSDIRIFSLTKLLQTKNKVKGSNKQHTCHYFLKNFKKMRYFNLVGKKSLFRPNYRLTLDYPEDLKLFKIIFKRLKNKVNLKSAIKFLDKNPDLVKINMNKKDPKYWI